jgi:hypothetical protein
MKKLLILILVLGATTAAWGGELAGVAMPETVEIGEQTLVLNGMGLRKKAFIKVYVAGLYLTEKMNSAEAILAADSARRTAMEFRFGVSADKMCDAWKEGLEKNTSNPADALRAKFETLCEYQADMEKGEMMIYTYVPDKGTEVEIKGEVKGTIEGKDFADALFACWIGPEPPGEAFKKGLLGL